MDYLDIIKLIRSYLFPEYVREKEFRVVNSRDKIQVYIPSKCLEIRQNDPYDDECILTVYTGQHWSYHSEFFMKSDLDAEFHLGSPCLYMQYKWTTGKGCEYFDETKLYGVNDIFSEFYRYISNVRDYLLEHEKLYSIIGNYVVCHKNGIVLDVYNYTTQMFETATDIKLNVKRSFKNYDRLRHDIYLCSVPRMQFFDHEVLYGYTPDGLIKEVRRDDPPTLTEYAALYTTREEAEANLF